MSLIKVRCDYCTFPFIIKTNISMDFNCPICGSNQIYIEKQSDTEKVNE